MLPKIIALPLAGAGIIALVTAAFVPFSAWSITTATTGIENNTPVAAAQNQSVRQKRQKV
jgi:hypothetical protein